MWSAEHSVNAAAAPEAVWRRYRDVGTWPEWNGAVESVVLDGEFKAGTRGTLTPPHQGPLPFRVVSAVENEGYVSETEIADTVTLRTISRLTLLPDGGTRITQRVELDGPGAPYFAQSFGSVIGAGLPRTLDALASAVNPATGGATKSALLVLTSTDTLGDTGRPTGTYASEAAEAWQVFSDAGYEVEVVSIRGGRPPLEAVDHQSPIQRAFFEDVRMSRLMADTPRPADADPGRYAIVLVAGGHGAVWDLPDDKDLTVLLRDCYEGGSVVAAVCHGPAALLNVTLSNGENLVAGKRVTAFSNAEERAVGMTGVVPFLLADALAGRGAAYEAAAAFMPLVVVDGRLVTGQNPASATGVAEAAVAAVPAGGQVS
jgi:putative intracellular protease/amidase